MRKISKIYLDLDGCVCDFEKRFEEICGMTPKQAENKKIFDNCFKKFIDEEQFASLDKMPDADKGIQFLRKSNVPVVILSSTGRPDSHEKIMKQKQIWLQKNGIPFQGLFVPGKHLKKNYATRDSILIDDTPINIDEWRAAGGIGILHKNWEDTIKMLEAYGIHD